MATIRKIQRKTGIAYKAIIKDRLGKAITSKIFTRKTDATIWSKRLEVDREAVAALGSKGAKMTFKQLVEEYTEQWQGKDQFWLIATSIRIRYRVGRGDKFALNSAGKGEFVAPTYGFFLDVSNTSEHGNSLRAFTRAAAYAAMTAKARPPCLLRRVSAATVNRHKNTLSESLNMPCSKVIFPIIL